MGQQSVTEGVVSFGELRAFSELVEAIHAAAADDAGWAEVAPYFPRLMRDAGPLIGIHTDGDPAPVHLVAKEIHPELLRRFKQHWEPEVFKGIQKRARPRDGRRHVSGFDSMWSPEEFVRTPMYEDFWQPADIWDQREALVLRGPGRSYAMSVATTHTAGRFTERELQLLDLIIPHLELACRLREQRLMLADEQDGHRSALDRIGCALFRVDRCGAVLWMNRAAERELGRNELLQVWHGRLCARHHAANVQFHAAIAALAGLRQVGGGFDACLPVVVSGPADERLTICWLTAFIGGREPTVLVAVNDANAPAERLEAAVRAYRLTPAQSRLALLLLQGMDLPSAAEALGVSRNTARTQLRRIFDKTGTSSQTMLARRLISAMPPFA
jgi:DNA-binding CsgD family transcriptional regulator/PAS domain-containing protein